MNSHLTQSSLSRRKSQSKSRKDLNLKRAIIAKQIIPQIPFHGARLIKPSGGVSESIETAMSFNENQALATLSQNVLRQFSRESDMPD